MKIENDFLYIDQNKGSFSKQTVVIRLTDIDIIYLGNEKYLRGVPDRESISRLEAFYSMYTPSLAASLAIRRSPVLVIVLKEGQTYIISTNPYSKNSFRILLHELVSKYVNIVIRKTCILNIKNK
jgi:hypothetical protein